MANPERVEQQLVAGWQALERGDPGAAESIAREVLRQAGPDALDMIARNLLGVALMQQARHQEALDALAAALERDPGSTGTRINLGSALAQLGRHADAVAHFEGAAKVEPRLFEAHNNLGHSLKELGRLDEAVDAYRAALALDPASVPAQLNLGIALQAQGLIDAAAGTFSRVLELDPANAEARALLGAARRAQGNLRESVAHLEAALSLDPGHLPALVHLGAAYQEQGRLAEAAACFERAVVLDPRSAEVRHNLGIALQGLSRHDEAVACFREALRLEPQHKYTPGALLWSGLMTCRWDQRDAETRALRVAIRAGAPVIEPFALTAVSEDPEEQALCAKRYFEDRVKARERVWKGERYGHEKVRVAYVSADFREHAVAYCLAELIELHDRSKFEIVGASLGADDGSAIRARLMRGFDRFIDLRPLGDLDAARLLRDGEIDVAVDLMGYTRGGRSGIFAHRPAPVQVGYLGFPGTVGADFLDYILADRVVLPEAHQLFFTEKVAYLPDCYQANDRKRDVAATAPARRELGLPESGFVFCCFNNSYKIAPRMFDVWMRLLDRVPGSVLWLLADNEAAAANLRKEARARGVAAERIVFAARLPAPEYRARCRLADLCLDTLPYNGHGTTGDMLWSGLPVLTCAGTAFPGRVAGSLLRAIGLPELVARDMGEYEATALRLAGSPGELAAIRAKLAANRSSSPLFDTDRFRRRIESAFTTMWELAQRGEAPRSFSVAA